MDAVIQALARNSGSAQPSAQLAGDDAASLRVMDRESASIAANQALPADGRDLHGVEAAELAQEEVIDEVSSTWSRHTTAESAEQAAEVTGASLALPELLGDSPKPSWPSARDE